MLARCPGDPLDLGFSGPSDSIRIASIICPHYFYFVKLIQLRFLLGIMVLLSGTHKSFKYFASLASCNHRILGTSARDGVLSCFSSSSRCYCSRLQKVENAQLKDEIRAAGVRIPEHPWVATAQETIPEEPLPEYLAALWEFAEGKSQSKKLRGSQAVAWQAPSSSSKTQESSTSFTSTKPSSTDQSPSKTEPSAPGEALEDAEKLCAFMEAAQTRSAKRPRVGNEGVLPRVWSDHGSTTSESRGSLESDDEAAGEREAAGRATGGTEGSASPSMWTSRQVLERYALPREVC